MLGGGGEPAEGHTEVMQLNQLANGTGGSTLASCK